MRRGCSAVAPFHAVGEKIPALVIAARLHGDRPERSRSAGPHSACSRVVERRESPARPVARRALFARRPVKRVRSIEAERARRPFLLRRPRGSRRPLRVAFPPQGGEQPAIGLGKELEHRLVLCRPCGRARGRSRLGTGDGGGQAVHARRRVGGGDRGGRPPMDALESASSISVQKRPSLTGRPAIPAVQTVRSRPLPSESRTLLDRDARPYQAQSMARGPARSPPPNAGAL